MTHFVKLFIISTDPECIVGLCALFETVLQSKDLQLFIHLRKIDCQPLRIVFKWLVRAFSGYLLSSQLLDLWDRVIAYNSLQILPSNDFWIFYSACYSIFLTIFVSLIVFAVGVFLFRKQNIMAVTNRATVESILDDLTSLKTTVILQLVLL